MLLTPDSGRRADRAIAAAEAKHQAGVADVAAELLVIAEAGPLEELARARISLLRGQMAFSAGNSSDTPRLLIDAARRFEALDTRLARKVTSVRMVSLTQRAIAAINYTVESAENKLRLVVQSELVANEELPQVSKDPRLSAILQSPLVSEEHQIYDGGLALVVLVHKTRASGLRMAAGMSHEITGPERMRTGTECFPDLGRTFMAAEVAPGEKLRILQAGARAENRPIAAKGLTGTGYGGHTFWDTESFVLPVLTYTQPSAAADALRWRHIVLPEARPRVLA